MIVYRLLGFGFSLGLIASIGALPAYAQARGADAGLSIGMGLLNGLLNHRGNNSLDSTRLPNRPPYQLQREVGSDPSLKTVQEVLLAKGFDPGEPTGKITEKTTIAIADFQRMYNFPVTGRITRAQIAVLMKIDPRPASSLSQSRNLYSEYNAGSNFSNKDVSLREVQLGLIAHGYDAGEANGRLSEKTTIAIADFQRANNFLITGRITRAQIAVLLSQRDPLNNGSAYAFAASGSGTPSEINTSNHASVQRGTSKLQDTLQDIGLKIFNGDVVLASSTVGFDGYSEGLDKLQRLLLLKSNPNLIDEVDKTIYFVPVLDKAVQSRYVDNQHWKGKNEFQQSDSRERFLREQKQRVFSLIPSLPITFAEVMPFSAGRYDSSKGALSIGLTHYDPWPSAQFKVEAPSPFEYPKIWTLPSNAARTIVEMQTDRDGTNSIDRLTAVVRTKLTGVRAIDGGVMFEFVSVGNIKVYDSRRFSNIIGEVPLSQYSVRDPSSERKEQILAEFTTFDPIYPRLLSAKLRPESTNKDIFVSESFRIRRQIERHITKSQSDGQKYPTTDLPLIMPASMLRSEIEPSSTNLEDFKYWLLSATKNASDVARIYNICPSLSDGRNSGGDCSHSPSETTKGSTSLDLSKIMTRVNKDWDYASVRGEWINSAIAVSKDRYPNAASHLYISAGRDLPTILSLSSNPAWFDFVVPGLPHDISELSIDIKVVSYSIVSDSVGKSFLSIEAQPAFVNYKLGEKSQRIPIPAYENSTLASKRAQSASKYDVLGVKVGMSMEEVLAILEPLADQNGMKKEEYSRQNDPFFEHALMFSKKNAGNSLIERIVVFYAAHLAHRPVLAVGRFIDISERGFSDDREAANVLLPQLIEKYGNPDAVEVTGRTQPHWAVLPVVKAVLKKGISYDHNCSFFRYRNFFDTVGMFSSFDMKGSCGEMAGAFVSRQNVMTFVIDDHLLDELRSVKAAANVRPAAPPIKF